MTPEEASPFQVYDYHTAGGKEPFKAWIDALQDREAAAAVRARLARVRAGNWGSWKPVGAGVFELRIDHGPGYRVYFGRIRSQAIILLNAGIKKTQAKDIETAKGYWADCRRRLHE